MVLVAHDGRTFELRVGPETGVAAVREALAGLAGVPEGQQLLLCGGARLEGGRLGQHGLPAEDRDVFLFNRELLRADAAPAELEALPFLSPGTAAGDGEGEGGIGEGSGSFVESVHPLDESPSPLLRALPMYRREFAKHRRAARQGMRRAREGFAECQRLLAEMEVQALAIDAARENVDVHYAHIARAQESFLAGFEAAGSRYGALLDGFEGELEQMGRIPLQRSAPPTGAEAPAGPSGGVSAGGRLRQHGFRTLADLVPVDKLRAWAAHCRTARGQFGSRVQELTGQVPGLQKDVEALFMTLPSVDLKELGLQIDGGERQVAELASIVECLEKDTTTVERLVEEASAHLAQTAAPPGGVAGSLSQSRLQPLDAIAALEPMNDLHAGTHLPRSQELVAGVERLAAHCLKCKNAMNRSVHSQIKRIAALQSSIRDTRNKILAFQEVGRSQEKAFRELELARRVPLAFQACLAEVLRRQAFEKIFAAQAYGLAESMAATSAAEMAKRQVFLQHYEQLLPRTLLEALGLAGLPPSCEVSIMGSSQGGGLSDSITLEDFKAFTKQVPSLFNLHRDADQSLAKDLERNSARVEKELAASEQSPASGIVNRPPPVPQDKTADIQLARLKAEVAASTALFHALQLETGWKTPAEDAGPGSPSSGSSSPRSSQPAPPSHDVLVQKTARALKQQDDFIISLEAEVVRWRNQNQAQEARIAELEESALPPLDLSGETEVLEGAKVPEEEGRGRAGSKVELEDGSALIYTAVPEKPAEKEVRIALDITGVDPVQIAERVDRLYAAVAKFTGRSLPDGLLAEAATPPSKRRSEESMSPLEILDMTIEMVLDGSSSAQGSAGSASAPSNA